MKAEHTHTNTTSVKLRDRKARIAIALVFFVNGTIFASWIPFIPLVRDHYNLSEGQLGLMLLCITIGAIVTLPITGVIISRTGSTLLIRLAALGNCLILPVIIFSTNIYCTIGTLVIFGVCNGMIDVAMNSQAVEIEKRYQRHIMSSFHAMFSLGGLTGSGLASLFLNRGFSPEQYIGFIFVTMLITVTIIQFYFLPNRETILKREEDHHEWLFPTGNLLLLGLLGMLVLMGEGAMADWSAVFMTDTLNTDIQKAALAYAAFSLTMTLARFGGDVMTAHLGPTLITRLGSGLAGLGLLIALISNNEWVAILGFALVGIGVANVVPVIFSAAGSAVKDSPGKGIAAVSTAGYFGFLAGPPLIGFVAEVTNLSVAMGVVAAGFFIVTAMAPIVKKF